LGFISKAIEPRNNIENPKVPLTSKNFLSMFGSKKSKADVIVNEKTILTLSGVFSAIRVLSETVACLPLIYYHRDGERKERATADPLYTLMHGEPNSEQTSYKFREGMMYQAGLKGNAFAWIERDRLKRPLGLWPLTSSYVKLERILGKLWYRYYDQKKSGYERIPAEDMLHIFTISSNGLIGLSLLEMVLKELGGIGLASQDYAAKWFANSASNGAVLEHPGTIGDDAAKRIKKQVQEEYSGLKNSHKVKLLEEGMKLHELGGDPSTSQLLEQRKYTVSEAARIWRIPPHLIGDLEHATFTNIEHQSLEFIKYTMLPWFTNWEQELNRKLIPAKNKGNYYFEFLVDALARGDMAARAEYFNKGIMGGWLNRDEARAKENMNPIPNGDGKKFWMPLNMIPIDESNPKLEKKSNNIATEQRSIDEVRAKKAGAVRRKLRKAYVDIFEDIFDRVFKVEYKELQKAIKKHLNKRDSKTFIDWLETFYFDTFPEKSETKLKRAFNSLAKAIAEEAGKEVDSELSEEDFSVLVDDYTKKYIDKHCATSRMALTRIINKSLMDDSDTVELLNNKIDSWEENRASAEALDETVGVEGAFSRAVFLNAGLNLVWVTSGKNCELCDSLSGKVVGRDESFLAAGEEIETTKTTFSRKSNVLHAPLHDGCDCHVVPG